MSKLDHQNKVSTTFKNILNVIEYQSKNCDLKSWHGFGLHICDKLSSTKNKTAILILVQRMPVMQRH